MSALRKVEPLSAGHRQAWLHELLASDIDLSADARLLLCVLTLHHGDHGVYPGLRRLNAMTGMPIGRVREARDELGRRGIISYVLGSGRRPTLYQLTSLEDWHVGRCGKPDTQRSIACADQPVSVSTVGTKPLEPLNTKMSESNVLSLMPSIGWRGLVARASADYRQHWLDKLTLISETPTGTVLRTLSSLCADRVRRDLEPGGTLHNLALAVGLDPESVTIEAPRCGHDPYARQNVREGDAGGYDAQRSNGRQLRQWMDRTADRIETRTDGADVVSLASFRARHEPGAHPN